MVNAQITSAREEYKLGISEDELLRQRIEEKAARSNTEGELKWQKRQEKLRGFGETVSTVPMGKRSSAAGYIFCNRQ